MAIQLRQDEQIHREAHMHWSNYIVPGILAVIFGSSFLVQLFSELVPEESKFFTALIAFGPISYVWLRNKTKAYVVTNQRLYVEEGIVAKNKTDIPFNKINDISFNQGLFQRIFGAGNIAVMTGNNKPTVLKNLDQPEKFREALSAICNKKSAS